MGSNFIHGITICLLMSYMTNADTSCTAKFDKRPKDILTTGQNVKLFCEVNKCRPVSKVIYEKTDVVSPIKWTSVYEGFDSTNHRPLESGTNYDVAGRVMFTALTSTFILEILSVTVKDNFKWRCIVIDHNNVQHVSNSVQLTVVPEQNVTIKPTRPKLVAGQGMFFTCEIDKIYPQPNIAWKVDGNNHFEDTTSITPYNDGLMLVRSRIDIQFSKPGRTVVICSLQTTTGEPWLEHEITVDVKSPAQITDPEDEMNINATIGSTIVINCTASGYRPTITWQRNGFQIRNDDPQYVIKDNYNITLSTSILTLSPISIPLTCEKIEEYNSVYTCTAKLKQPYKSLEKSKAVTVKVLHPPQIRRIPHTVITDEMGTVTLWCDVCSSFDSTSEWTYGGRPLHGDNIKFQQDGTVQISGNPRSGGYHRNVSNSIGSIDCVVYLVNTSHKEDLGFLIVIVLGLCILIFEVIIRRQAQTFVERYLLRGTLRDIAQKLTGRFQSRRNENTLRDGRSIEPEQIPLLPQDAPIIESSITGLNRDGRSIESEQNPLLSQDSPIIVSSIIGLNRDDSRPEQIPLLPQDAPTIESSIIGLNGALLVKTFGMKDLMRCIWSAKRTERVFVGGLDSSSITIIDTLYQPIEHTLTTGDYIRYGLAIDDSYHLVNTYYIKKKKHSIQLVKIDAKCRTTQIIKPTYTLDLRCAATPRCLFYIDKYRIGIYCVDGTGAAVISLQVSDILTQVNPLPVNRIELEHHHASLSDKLCVRENGEMCVVSYFDGDVYIYKRSGELHKTISRPGFDKMSFPRHVLALSNNSLVFVTMDMVQRYDGVSKWDTVKLNSGYVVSAVFTNSLLWCCDSDKKINVYSPPR